MDWRDRDPLAASLIRMQAEQIERMRKSVVTWQHEAALWQRESDWYRARCELVISAACAFAFDVGLRGADAVCRSQYK